MPLSGLEGDEEFPSQNVGFILLFARKTTLALFHRDRGRERVFQDMVRGFMRRR